MTRGPVRGPRRRQVARATALALACILAVLAPAATAVADDEPAATATATAVADDEPAAPTTDTTTTDVATTGTTTQETAEDATPPPSPPKAVASWYTGAGLEAAEADAEDLPGEGDLVLGPPHPVHRWAPDFADGTQSTSPIEPDGQWVAAIVRDSPDGAVPVGALRAGPFDGAEPQDAVVVTDADVGGLVQEVEPGLSLVHDATIDGWFATADGEVWSVGAQGREMLHGVVPLSVLQAFLAERGSSPTPTEIDDDGEAESSGLVPLAVIAAIVLLGLVGAWLLVRNYRKADSRLEADIRAGLTPLDGVPRLDGAPSTGEAQDATPGADGPRSTAGRAGADTPAPDDPPSATAQPGR